MGALIARHGFDRVEIPHPAQAGPTQDPRRRRFGYRRPFILLRQDGERSAINRIYRLYRLYREEGLTVRNDGPGDCPML
jgi:hypothetical protein